MDGGCSQHFSRSKTPPQNPGQTSKSQPPPPEYSCTGGNLGVVVVIHDNLGEELYDKCNFSVVLYHYGCRIPFTSELNQCL